MSSISVSKISIVTLKINLIVNPKDETLVSKDFDTRATLIKKINSKVVLMNTTL